MARRSNHPATLAGVVIWAYGFAIHYEVLRADDSTLRAIQEAVQIAEASSNDVALSVAEYSLGVALLSRDAAADHRRGLELIVPARDIWLRKQVALQMVPIADLWVAQARAGGGDRDAAIAVMAQSWTSCTGQDGSGMGFGAPAFWRRRCSSVAPRATWPKPKRRSTG